MTTVAERTTVDAAQNFLTALDMAHVSIGTRSRGLFSASCYWPNGDILKDAHCYGSGSSLSDALGKMMVEVEKAKIAAPILKTAAECKAAVIALIQQHDAAPASFRDAVDALPVKP